MRLPMSAGVSVALTLVIAGCSGNYASKEKDNPYTDGSRQYDPDAPGLFGDGGLSLNKVLDGTLFGDEKAEGGSTSPVNKYLWQASLDTISFMPLASTDPFTGVIATDWSATEAAPGERFKVTVYLTSPALAATRSAGSR